MLRIFASICLILLLIQSVTRGENGVFWRSKLPTSYEAAKERCNSMDMTLTFPDLSSRSNEPQIWLPLVKHKYDKWRTLTRTTFGHTDINPAGRTVNQDCAYLRLKDGLLDETYCNRAPLDYVCLHDASRPCPLEGNCVTFTGNLTLVFIRGTGSWYDGWKGCQALGTTLAQFNRSQLTEIITTTRAVLGPTGNYAVGVVLSRWVDSRNISDFNYSYVWGAREPQPDRDCSVAVSGGDSIYWKAVRCTEQHHFICSRGETKEQESEDAISNNGTPCPTISAEILPTSSQPDYLGLLLLVSFFLTVISVFLAIWVCHLKDKLKKKKDHQEEATETIKSDPEEKTEHVDVPIDYEMTEDNTVSLRDNNTDQEEVKVEEDKVLLPETNTTEEGAAVENGDILSDKDEDDYVPLKHGGRNYRNRRKKHPRRRSPRTLRNKKHNEKFEMWKDDV